MEELKRNAAGGFDVIYDEKNRERFKWFINERNEITRKKSEGQQWPWTSDEILQKVKINNLDRRDDYGTQYLLNLSDEDKKRIVQIIFIYRFSGSNVKLMDKLLKSCASEWSEIMKDEVIFYSKAYQRPNFPKGKGSGRYFMTEHSVEMSRKLEKYLVDFDGTMKELVGWMCDRYQEITNQFNLPYKRMLFHSNEVAKDLSYFYSVSGAGDCEIGPGAKKGLQCIFGNGRHDSNFKVLQEELNKSPEYIENCLCEFRKYLEYKNGKRIRPNNVYTPRKNISGWNEPVGEPEANKELDPVEAV